jgi:hypothetical protein
MEHLMRAKTVSLNFSTSLKKKVLKLKTISCEFIEFLFDSNFYEYVINANKYLRRFFSLFGENRKMLRILFLILKNI